MVIHSQLERHTTPWFADYANYIVGGVLPPNLNYNQRKRFLFEVKRYFWDDPNLYKECGDGLYQRFIPQWQIHGILEGCHSSPYGGHQEARSTIAKILQLGFFWPTMFQDAREFIVHYDVCQRTGNISWRNEMPQRGILEV
ncbi:uncharacterized protein LOC141632947 [Silene latifolia]|uniref:uncharacterized protein LOC141632947 n=1 Tax=Silene latifolia TaxID=37657 RepID=UPI003D7730B3